jgi:hypothetical protein
MSAEGGQASDGIQLDRWLQLAAQLVPAHKRADWVREWQAELWHLRQAANGPRPVKENLSLAWGLLADAGWLRVDWLRSSMRGSAGLCLAVLAFCCIFCAGAEWIVAGSWRALESGLVTHFMGGYGFVVAPAMLAALITYPLRPLRWDCGARWAGLSARARWNLFLVAKVALTLLVCFLGTMLVMEPVRVLAAQVVPHGMIWLADWVELIFSAVVVTTALRWALLNQERRCQRCLKLLSEPTRVGPGSRNFLEWNGTELVCAEGHGRLHVAEMQGSWCWYDLWLEIDSGWHGIFGS